MSNKHSRKSFLAKLAGISAAIGILPRVLARESSAKPALPSGRVPFQIRPDERAVARRGDVV